MLTSEKLCNVKRVHYCFCVNHPLKGSDGVEKGFQKNIQNYLHTLKSNFDCQFYMNMLLLYFLDLLLI